MLAPSVYLDHLTNIVPRFIAEVNEKTEEIAINRFKSTTKFESEKVPLTLPKEKRWGKETWVIMSYVTSLSEKHVVFNFWVKENVQSWRNNSLIGRIQVLCLMPYR